MKNENSCPVVEANPATIYQDLCITLWISEMVIFVSEWNLRENWWF